MVNEAGVVMGRLYASDMTDRATATAGEVMRLGPSTYRPNVDVVEISERIEANKLTTVLVTTAEGRLLGIARSDEILAAAAPFRDHAGH